jgi:RecB family exonuclease
MPFEFVSADHFKRWERCQLQYKYRYLLRLQWPADQSNFELGKSVHKLLEFQSRGIDGSLVATQAREDIRKSWQLLMAHPITQLPVLANEWGFTVPLAENTWLNGRIDRIARDEAGRVLIIDWKTGTGVPRNPDAAWQTVIYCFAVMEAREELGLPDLTPEQIRFVYVEVRDAVRLIEIPYDSIRHETTRSRLLKTLNDIQTATDHRLPDRCPDKFCSFRPLCGIDHAAYTTERPFS